MANKIHTTRTLYITGTPVGNTTLPSTLLGSFTLDANTLASIDDCLKIRIWMNFTAGASAGSTIYFGNTKIKEPPNVAGPNNNFHDIVIVKYGPSQQSIYSGFHIKGGNTTLGFGGSGSGEYFPLQLVTTEDDTKPITISVYGNVTGSVAQVAFLNGMIIEFTN